jgi:hypothetical protein
LNVPLILRQLISSEKFLYVVLFMLPITVFTALGLMTVDDWRHDALWALGMLISGKTVQGVADRIAAPRAPVSHPPQPHTGRGQATRPMTAEELAELGVGPRRPPEPPPPIRPGE